MRHVFLTLATILGFAAPALANPFTKLRFYQHHEYHLACPVSLECDIEFEPGERINNGYKAYRDWESHVGYTGDRTVTAHLVVRPETTAIETNIILTTTRRTYYLVITPTHTTQPQYYSFVYERWLRSVGHDLIGDKWIAAS